jgi:hypothetical protein
MTGAGQDNQLVGKIGKQGGQYGSKKKTGRASSCRMGGGGSAAPVTPFAISLRGWGRKKVESLTLSGGNAGKYVQLRIPVGPQRDESRVGAALELVLRKAGCVEIISYGFMPFGSDSAF